MDYLNKTKSQAEILQKTLRSMNRHDDALHSFEPSHKQWQETRAMSLSLQEAGKALLATPGINKNILSLQNIFEQLKNTQKILPSTDGVFAVKALASVDSGIGEYFKESQKILHGTEGVFSAKALASLNSGIDEQFRETQSILRKIMKSPVMRLFYEQPLNQISHQIPFFDRLQSKLFQMQQLFKESQGIESLLDSNTFKQSTLAIASASIDFSSALDNVDYSEQVKIVDFLDNINLDLETEEVLPKELSDETQTEYITFKSLVNDYWKTNRDSILGILATAHPTVLEIYRGDLSFSNLFVVVLFVYFCTNLIITPLVTDNKVTPQEEPKQ